MLLTGVHVVHQSTWPWLRELRHVERAAREAVTDLGVEARIEKSLTTWILTYRGAATSELVINEKLVYAGRIPGTIEVKTWLTNALA